MNKQHRVCTHAPGGVLWVKVLERVRDGHMGEPPRTERWVSSRLCLIVRLKSLECRLQEETTQDIFFRSVLAVWNRKSS